MEVEIPAQQQQGRAQGQSNKSSKASAWQLTVSAARNPLLVANFVLLAAGTACGPLLLRAYFVHGGSRKWLSSLLQTAGWPLLLVPLCASFFSRRRRLQRDHGSSRSCELFFMTPRLLAASAAIGIMTGVDNFFYAYGQAYLPVSTSSILLSTQLVFTAAFALLLVRQRFAAATVNAVVLLTAGAAMLGVNAGGDRPEGVSAPQYRAGFGMVLGAAALYGLLLPAMELSQARHAGAVTYTLVVEIQLVIGLGASAFCAVGMIVNKDFQGIPAEARESELGEAGDYLLLAGTAFVFQCICLGTIGAIFYGSALLAGVVLAMFIPVNGMLAVLFFHEPFSATKGIALGISLWGLLSYLYGEVRTKQALQSGKHQDTEQPMV